MTRLSILLYLFISTSLLSQNKELELNSKINDVTVFLSGAEIHRTSKVVLNTGVTELKLSELSPSIDAKSIQAKLESKDVIIISVNHKMNYLSEASITPKIKAVTDSLEDMRLKLEIRKSHERVYKEEKSMLLVNKSIKGEQSGVDVEDLMEMADFYRSRLQEIETKLIDINHSKNKIQATINNLNKHLRQLNSLSRKNTSEIFVKVSCKTRISTTLNISYVVNQAGWVPKYDVRSNNTTDPINLTYKADVYQNTGVEWDNVSLTLSTGNPTINNSQPELSQWYLQYYNSYKNQQRKKSYAANQQYGNANKIASQSVGAMPSRMDDEDNGFYATADIKIEEESRSSANFTSVTNSTVNAEFAIALPYSITSDGQANTVEIQKYELPVSYEYFAIPKLDKDAFLLARISGWGEYNLLPADVNVYFEGTSVGTSYLNTETTNDTLDISMGRDNSIIITRKKIKDFNKTTTLGSNKKSQRGYEISIRNNKNNAITLTLLDQLPLSKTKDIEISLYEDGGANHNEITGTLKWSLNINPGETNKISYKYSVKYPKNKTISNL